MASPPRHLLQLEGLGRDVIEHLFERTRVHLKTEGSGTRPLAGCAVANLFYESSTRTRFSFERAARALGADVLNLEAAASSVAKGESLLDTVRNIEAMGVKAFVVRHGAAGAAAFLARAVNVPVINAGDGAHEHPSQGLLDAFTLLEHLGTLQGKRILIAGDVLHSRVARSNAHILKTLGAEVVFSGPPTLIPAGVEEGLGARVEPDFDRALLTADAVMMLRVQLERQQQAMFPSVREYARNYGLNAARAERLAAGVPILHPGPINRNVELGADVADSARSLVLKQVTHGVAVRMSIFEWCCG